MLFDSAASIAVSFRSTCGSLRKPPEWSSQRLPGPTRHVGQGTELNSSGDMSLILIVTQCNKTHPGDRSNRNTN
jgi:hypothetical protein